MKKNYWLTITVLGWTLVALVANVVLAVTLNTIGLIIGTIIYITIFVLLAKSSSPKTQNLWILVVLLAAASLLSFLGGWWLLSHGWQPVF